jgi:hypothetical protein
MPLVMPSNNRPGPDLYCGLFDAWVDCAKEHTKKAMQLSLKHVYSIRSRSASFTMISRMTG